MLQWCLTDGQIFLFLCSGIKLRHETVVLRKTFSKMKLINYTTYTWKTKEERVITLENSDIRSCCVSDTDGRKACSMQLG